MNNGNIYLCVGESARVPYYLEFADFYLYSIEELCFFFIDKIHLLSDDLVCSELVTWIREECCLEELAEELDTYVRKQMSLAAFVSTILERTHMYDSEVVKKVELFLKEQAMLTPYEKEKKRADYFYQTGRFRQALLLYSSLLENTNKEDVTDRAILNYNIASIYAMDFDYDNAASFYRESYELLPNVQTRQAYILAKRLCMNDFEFGEFKRENLKWKEDIEEVIEMIEQCEAGWQESREKEILQIAISNRRTGELIRSLKQDYRRQTQ